MGHDFRAKSRVLLNCGAMLFTLAGCSRGPQLAPVSGQVTLDGKALESAEVKFQPANGRASHGVTDANGRFELRYTRDQMGAVVGPHTVRILSATEVTLPNGQFQIRPQLVPGRYNSQSELREEVKAGEDNQFNFELTSDKK